MVVLVTGGSSGIGLATVRRLAAGGHRVFTASRRPARTELPAGVTPLTFDAGDPSAASAVVAQVVEEAGRLDVLVNNAGAGAVGAVEETTEEDAHHVMEVNVFGPLRLIRAAIPVMRAQGGGRILNVSSLNDTLPAPFGGWYSASKAALTSLSYVLRAELHGSGIHVTVVAPGLFLTDMARSLSEEPPDEGSLYGEVLRRLREENANRLSGAGDPDDVGAAVAACVEDVDPLARIVVGLDAVGFESLVRQSSVDDLAAMLGDYVVQLSSG